MLNLNEFENYLERKSYSFNTKKMYNFHVRNFLAICEKKKLDPLLIKGPDMFRLVDSIGRHRSNKSVNAYLAAVSAFYSYLLSYGYIDNLPITKGHYLKANHSDRKALTKEEQEIFKTYFLEKGEKQKHSFLMMLFGGLRVSELKTIKNLTLQNNLIRFDVVGKRNKKRTVFIDDYPEVKPLLRFFKDGNSLDLSTSSLKNSMNYASKKLGIKMSCHTLRHTYATNKASISMPISVLQTLMGHADISVTAQYVHLQEDSIIDYFANKDH